MLTSGKSVCSRTVLWTDCELGVALVDEQPTLPHALQVAHKLFFEQAPVDRLLVRRLGTSCS